MLTQVKSVELNSLNLSTQQSQILSLIEIQKIQYLLSYLLFTRWPENFGHSFLRIDKNLQWIETLSSDTLYTLKLGEVCHELLERILIFEVV